MNVNSYVVYVINYLGITFDPKYFISLDTICSNLINQNHTLYEFSFQSVLSLCRDQSMQYQIDAKYVIEYYQIKPKEIVVGGPRIDLSIFILGSNSVKSPYEYYNNVVTYGFAIKQHV